MNLSGKEGELRFILEITRAETGKTETVEMIGKIGDFIETQQEELNNGGHTLSSGS